MGFEPSDTDHPAKAAIDAQHFQGEQVCGSMPLVTYVEIDGCDCHFVHPAPCFEYRSTGHNASCLICIISVQPGTFALKPLSRRLKYYSDPRGPSNYMNVQRKQFPLMPANAMPLFSIQGTTAQPGMIAYWFFPRRCSQIVKWLIVYVMISRPRSLATLQSVGLTDKLHGIIGQSPPEALIATFHKLFDAKIKDTKALAVEVAKR